MKRGIVFAVVLFVATVGGCASPDKDARKDAPRSIAGRGEGFGNTGATPGLTPAGGPAAGVVPDVRPAGAVTPSGTTGTGSYLMPGARPANPADCNH